MIKIDSIPSLDKAIGEEVATYIDTLTKPVGSLGKLEQLAVTLAEITGDFYPEVSPPGILLFAADHGIAEEGVSAYPQAVTAQMVVNFLNNGAAINVFSKQIGALFEIIDVGIAQNIEAEGLVKRKIRFGTRNFYNENALTETEVKKAITVGKEEANALLTKGVKSLIIGEMGIGNTTTASALLLAMTNEPAKHLVGHGTGLTMSQVQHKQNVIEKALAARKPDGSDPFDLLIKFGGLEIAAMAGSMLEAARQRTAIIIDGFICTVAALIARKMNDRVANFMIAGHQSTERGHATALELLRKQPLLHMDMRLGEGTGAALAFPIVAAAANMLKEMATFSEANVSRQDGEK